MGDCKVRLYETGLVVIPLRSEIFRIPYSDILEVKEEDYALIITTDFGERLILSKMGWQLDPFKKMLTTINNELQSKVLALLQELFPDENTPQGSHQRSPLTQSIGNGSSGPSCCDQVERVSDAPDDPAQDTHRMDGELSAEIFLVICRGSADGSLHQQCIEKEI